ncbi:MAG: three-Cys-motif partner protein TcmP [Eubacterium sp.]|nr:three-Cys-motif partner protein TcmP [Eubacterium sp.]
MAKSNKDFFKSKKDWSVIKDRLLGCYLIPYFQKLLKSNKPIFYVDCFAGKGKFEDGNDGSPLIALRARDTCIQQTTIKNKSNAIQMCFIDLNYANDLKINTLPFEQQYNKLLIVDGAYEKEIDSILQNKQGFNVFLYIDPYGIKALDSILFERFNNYGFATFEMLINFNSFGFFRDACQVMNVKCDKDEAFDLSGIVEYEPTEFDTSNRSEKLLTNIVGGEYWKDIVKDYNDGKIDGYKAERRLSYEYKQYLKQKYKYVLDMPIRLKEKQQPKYRMIHVCNHEAGCYLMAENMQKRKNELFLDIQKGGQLTFFDESYENYSSVEGDILTEKDIEKFIAEHLSKCALETRLTKFLATFVNQYGLICEFSVIYEILKRMSDQRQIEIIRNPSITVNNNKPTTFWSEKESEGKTITVRRLKV